MSFQNDLAALIDGGLNSRNINIRVARSDDDRLRRCACCQSEGYRWSENQETKRDAHPFHILDLHWQG
jgi:hypothetical protein